MSSKDLLIELEEELLSVPAGIEKHRWITAANAVLGDFDSSNFFQIGQTALRICQHLHGQARSFDALPIALAILERATDFGNLKMTQLFASASGLLSSDTADFAGALEFHGQALELMNGLSDEAGASRTWNNIGSALCGVGRYELASVSFGQALEKLDRLRGPQIARFGAYGNLAQCAFHTGQVERGIEFAQLALTESALGYAEFTVDPFSELLVRRNMIRLLVLQGDLKAAEVQIRIAKDLAAGAGNVRASIALSTAQAVIDIARGHLDIADTRLQQCLTAARPIRPALTDTLACMVRADEATGNSARALTRLQELSDLMHDASAFAARSHIGISTWRQSFGSTGVSDEHAVSLARLSRQRDPASIPVTWQTLTRLALGNSLQIDVTAAHGARVGALSRLLAQACNLNPVEALEIGLAAQIHDVGIAADQENLLGRFGQTSDGAAAEADFSHCETGWKILCEDDHPRMLLAREIAKYHHAWVNGEGHPGGLIGRSIPLHARICAVADAYDNIMHAGRSGSGITIAAGLNRLRVLSGTRLDRDLVGLFADTLEDETRNEGIEIESQHGLTSFHQLIKSLSGTQRYL